MKKEITKTCATIMTAKPIIPEDQHVAILARSAALHEDTRKLKSMRPFNLDSANRIFDHRDALVSSFEAALHFSQIQADAASLLDDFRGR